jgi:hypothetical protein
MGEIGAIERTSSPGFQRLDFLAVGNTIRTLSAAFIHLAQSSGVCSGVPG